MNLSDIFESSFLEGYASADITGYKAVICLMLCAAFGLYIFLAYRVLTRKSFFDKNFVISLPVIAVITGAIILTVQSNIVISLGMVGALSIVRFRTAIKDPIDLAFLFWAISVGIICGAGLALIAVMLSVIITIGMFFLDWITLGKAAKLLVVNASNANVEDAVLNIAKTYCKYHNVKSRTISNKEFNMVVEVRLTKERELITEISELSGITFVSLLAHDGEVTF